MEPRLKVTLSMKKLKKLLQPIYKFVLYTAALYSHPAHAGWQSSLIRSLIMLRVNLAVTSTRLPAPT